MWNDSEIESIVVRFIGGHEDDAVYWGALDVKLPTDLYEGSYDGDILGRAGVQWLDWVVF